MSTSPSSSTGPCWLMYIPWLLGVTICLLLFNAALGNAGNSLNHLASTCNVRLLDSVRSWHEFGFWELGGLMTFRKLLVTLPSSIPKDLYSSQSTLYIVPHYFAYQLAGVVGFWQVIRASAYASAVLISLSVATLSWLIIEERSRSISTPRYIFGLVLFAAFAVVFPSEGIWGALWNSDDRALSAVLVAVSASGLALAIRLRSAWLHQLSAVLLVIAAIGCPRMGVMCAITVLIGRYALELKDSFVRAIYSWSMALALFASSAMHYIRLAVVDLTGRFILGGSSMLDRFGFIHKIKGKAQSDLDYESIAQSFGFAWRQSELMIDKISKVASFEHLLLYLLAGTGLIALITYCNHVNSLYSGSLAIITAPPLLWCVLINQSVAEHPDIHAITWTAALGLGLVYLVACLAIALRNRLGLFCSVIGGSWIAYWLFLWQVQYFLRAYPALRSAYPL
ncbi:MAG TPA: hypothetical protein QF700_11505 [Prochlorococcus sp.]|nr:hypothetical protein [Prochlorococcus sp.]